MDTVKVISGVITSKPDKVTEFWPIKDVFGNYFKRYEIPYKTSNGEQSSFIFLRPVDKGNIDFLALSGARFELIEKYNGVGMISTQTIKYYSNGKDHTSGFIRLLSEKSRLVKDPEYNSVASQNLDELMRQTFQSSKYLN